SPVSAMAGASTSGNGPAQNSPVCTDVTPGTTGGAGVGVTTALVTGSWPASAAATSAPPMLSSSIPLSRSRFNPAASADPEWPSGATVVVLCAMVANDGSTGQLTPSAPRRVDRIPLR